MTVNYKQILSDLDNGVIVCRSTFRKEVEQSIKAISEFERINKEYEDSILDNAVVSVVGERGDYYQCAFCSLAADYPVEIISPASHEESCAYAKIAKARIDSVAK